MTEQTTPATPTQEDITEAAAVDVPIPAPPGSGEVSAADPFPLMVEQLEHVPPLRDNGHADGAAGHQAEK